MTHELVSVIVPIYKVELYLDKCIQSIVNQTYDNLEIILIDDGSPDRCGEICDEWAKKDSRIKVIHQKNIGLGLSRNTGIEAANGEYIYFIDSDDYISSDAIMKCYSLITKENADLVQFGFNCFDENKIKSKNIPQFEKYIYENSDIQNYVLPNTLSFDPSTGIKLGTSFAAWSHFYSADLIKKNNWRFVSERIIISEDVYSLLSLYHQTKKIVILPEALYFHRINKSSLTQLYLYNRFEKNVFFYQEVLKLAKKLGYCNYVINTLSYPFIFNVIATLKSIINNEKGFKKKKDLITKIIKNNCMKKALAKMKFNTPNRTQLNILLFAMHKEYFYLCYFLLKIKNLLSK
jgi:glycosyltransferase involved in cell wall biosynthesis